jgi:hypothetical protein
MRSWDKQRPGTVATPASLLPRGWRKRRVIRRSPVLGLDRFPGLCHAAGIKAPVQTPDHPVAGNDIGVQPSHDERHMPPEFAMGGFGLAPENTIVIGRLTEQHLFDKETRRILEIRFRPARQGARVAERFTFAGSHFEEKGHPPRQGSAPCSRSHLRATEYAKGGHESFGCLHCQFTPCLPRRL